MIHWAMFKIIVDKEAAWSKSENLVKRKKIIYINFSKLKYLLNVSIINFYLKLAKIGDLSYEIQLRFIIENSLTGPLPRGFFS